MPLLRLTLITGCMFSGKTTALITRLRAAQAAGLSTLALKPSTDTRSGIDRLRAHTGDTLEAVDAPSLDAITAAFDQSPRRDVVALDEAHFFGAPLTPICLAALASPRAPGQIILAGVALDHFGDPFEPFASLSPHATEIVVLHAPCALCGKPAIHSQRMTAATDRIAVGGAADYQPRCADCFIPSPRR